MIDKRRELEHQVSVLANWLEVNSYNEIYTPKKAEVALYHVRQALDSLDKRRLK